MCLLQMEANNAVSVSYRYGIKVNPSEQVNVHSYEGIELRDIWAV